MPTLSPEPNQAVAIELLLGDVIMALVREGEVLKLHAILDGAASYPAEFEVYVKTSIQRLLAMKVPHNEMDQMVDVDESALNEMAEIVKSQLQTKGSELTRRLNDIIAGINDGLGLVDHRLEVTPVCYGNEGDQLTKQIAFARSFINHAQAPNISRPVLTDALTPIAWAEQSLVGLQALKDELKQLEQALYEDETSWETFTYCTNVEGYERLTATVNLQLKDIMHHIKSQATKLFKLNSLLEGASPYPSAFDAYVQEIIQELIVKKAPFSLFKRTLSPQIYKMLAFSSRKLNEEEIEAVADFVRFKLENAGKTHCKKIDSFVAAINLSKPIKTSELSLEAVHYGHPSQWAANAFKIKKFIQNQLDDASALVHPIDFDINQWKEKWRSQLNSIEIVAKEARGKLYTNNNIKFVLTCHVVDKPKVASSSPSHATARVLPSYANPGRMMTSLFAMTLPVPSERGTRVVEDRLPPDNLHDSALQGQYHAERTVFKRK